MVGTGDGGGEYHQLDESQRLLLDVMTTQMSDPGAYLDWEMKIAHVFSCNDYTEEQKAVWVEQQLKRKIATRRNSSNNFNQNWTDRSNKEGGNSSSPHGKSTVFSAKTKHNSASSSNTSTRNIKCFKCLGRGHIASDCPTKKTMIMKADGEITSESEISEEEEAKDELEEEAMQGDILMVRRLLESQMQPLNDTQRENIFHTRCTINGKLCSLIVDGGSCTNVASSRLVSKLNLDTQPHPRPYRLQWLSEDEEVKVTQ
ncbi:hypothetical protein HKD37_14G040531 [Glycine soja]